ncbi:hypothetical protein ABPG72_005896 [Tetrahymena utriculariae]
MQQLKIAQNNIYEKVINNLLNNITGQQAAYIISKVPDYFSLVQQGELKQAYTKLNEIYNQLENSKNKDLKIKKSQDNKMYKKFKELQSGYNKLRKNIKASEETIGQAPIGVRATKIKIKSRAATIKATPQGRTKTNEKEQQQEENKKIHKEVSRNHFIRE